MLHVLFSPYKLTLASFIWGHQFIKHGYSWHLLSWLNSTQIPQAKSSHKWPPWEMAYWSTTTNLLML